MRINLKREVDDILCLCDNLEKQNNAQKSKIEGAVMIIKRDVYLNRLICRMNNGMIKINTGIRRSGESYLLFELFHAYLIESGVQEDHIIKVSLDDEDYRQYRDPNELYEYLLKNMEGKEEQYYIFLDEVQFAISKNEIKNADEPIRLYGVLNGLLRRKNVDVCYRK